MSIIFFTHQIRKIVIKYNIQTVQLLISKFKLEVCLKICVWSCTIEVCAWFIKQYCACAVVIEICQLTSRLPPLSPVTTVCTLCSSKVSFKAFIECLWPLIYAIGYTICSTLYIFFFYLVKLYSKSSNKTWSVCKIYNVLSIVSISNKAKTFRSDAV